MRLSILNPGPGVSASPGAYLGGQEINDYSSLIWTERHRDYGEFQINIPRTEASSEIFWPGRLLGIQESEQVMLAETQQEAVNDEGYRDVVVKGRSAESIIEDRVLWGPHGTILTLARRYSYLDAALVYIWGAIMNDSINDVGYVMNRPSVISQTSKISGAVVTDSVYKSGASYPTNVINVNRGQMGPTIRKFLNSAGCGLRCVRPISDTSGIYSISVDTANGANKGLLTRTPMGLTSPLLRFDVYAGIDRSISPPVNGSLVFLSEEAGHLDNVDVSTTYREFITHTLHGVDATTAYGGTTSLIKTPDFGIRHRYIDAAQLVQGMDPVDQQATIHKAQWEYFQTHPNRAILSADLTTGTPFVFGTHYNLGDTIMLKYKTRTRRSLVNEYTRVDDREGQREYPGFVGWDEIQEGAPGVLNDW